MRYIDDIQDFGAIAVNVLDVQRNVLLNFKLPVPTTPAPTPTATPTPAPTPTEEPGRVEEPTPTPFETTNVNEEITVLPKTGEESKTLFYIIGAVFIVAGLWLFRRDSMGRG
ncbi:LPXTG cell wall anchor domain-containing protein [Paenibacillus sp. NPDC056722]|uniref:LPXTG cell wall anchor domain-containing protein n=1 Tax=Paenibacillus sp. NPDC056722 TaxID=3345924 RepID=UPI0036A9A8E4